MLLLWFFINLIILYSTVNLKKRVHTKEDKANFYCQNLKCACGGGGLNYTFQLDCSSYLGYE